MADIPNNHTSGEKGLNNKKAGHAEAYDSYYTRTN